MDASDLKETRVGGELIYNGRIVHLWRDEILLPDGKPGVREVVRHVGAVAVVPLTEEGDVLCVRQYRYPFAKVLLEIPAGKLDSKEENREAAARRELREETGAVCRELIPLGELYPSVAVCDEIISLYAAVGLDFGDAQPDEDEFLCPVRLPFERLVEMITAGEVPDAKTQVAVLKLKKLLDDGKINYRKDIQ